MVWHSRPLGPRSLPWRATAVLRQGVVSNRADGRRPRPRGLLPTARWNRHRCYGYSPDKADAPALQPSRERKNGTRPCCVDVARSEDAPDTGEKAWEDPGKCSRSASFQDVDVRILVEQHGIARLRVG